MKRIPKKLFLHPPAFCFPNNGKNIRLSVWGGGGGEMPHKQEPCGKTAGLCKGTLQSSKMQASTVAKACQEHEHGQGDLFPVTTPGCLLLSMAATILMA